MRFIRCFGSHALTWHRKIVDCTDGKHCQRLVTEAELETLLRQGWHVVVCLPSGKIVVSN